METPVTISGFIMGMFVTVSTERANHFRLERSMANAHSVPRTVASREDSTARMSEFFSAFSASPSRNSSPYQ